MTAATEDGDMTMALTRPLGLTAALAAFAAMATAQEPGPQSPFATPDQEWQLQSLNGAEIDGTSTLLFPEPGRVAGQALCNRFTGTATWDAGALSFGPLGATMMACLDAENEQAILNALGQVTAADLTGDTLVLTLADGGTMVYAPAPSE